MTKPQSSVRASRLSCAIYTRKSSEEGLEQDFNSLHAQREACAAFIQSQKSLGWVASSQSYDDGGYSGGNTERPGIQQLLTDIRAHKIKVVVVYKVDRLTRSLADFAKLVELFDSHGVSFVSVTQQFNTTTSMGRLTLNVLLSFAQFEREVTGERIRDKIAASKRKGMWMGGIPPMGYVPRERSLAIDMDQAIRVREIYKLYLATGNVRDLKAELDRRDWRTPQRTTKRPGAAGERPFSRGHLYRMLSNPIYIGKISHKGELYPGTHPPLIDLQLWQEVQNQLANNRQGARQRSYVRHASLLAGLVFDADGQRLVPTHAQKKSRRYSYYVSANLLDGGAQAKPPTEAAPSQTDRVNRGLRVPAHELESAVLQGINEFLLDERRLLDGANSESDQRVDANQLLWQARELHEALRRDAAQCIPKLILRVMVQREQLDIALRLSALMNVSDEDVGEPEHLWISVPVKLRQMGQSVRLVLGEQKQHKAPEKRLLDLLVQSHEWFDQLRSGRCKSVGELAESAGCSTSYVTRVMYLAFMDPEIVERIARGDWAEEVTAEKLIRLVPLPSEWTEQRSCLQRKG